MCAQKIIAPLCVAGSLPLALFIGQIVFAKLFAPVSSQLLRPLAMERVRFTGSTRLRQERSTKELDPMRGPQSSSDKAKAAFTLFSKLMCHRCWSSFPLGRGSRCSCVVHTSTQGPLTPPQHSHMCCRDFEHFLWFSEFFFPEVPCTFCTICSKSRSRRSLWSIR